MSAAQTVLKVVGAPGSPYTRKLRALLRYRRIPHIFVLRGGKDDVGIPDVPVGLIPVLVFPGEVVVKESPITKDRPFTALRAPFLRSWPSLR